MLEHINIRIHMIYSVGERYTYGYNKYCTGDKSVCMVYKRRSEDKKEGKVGRSGSGHQQRVCRCTDGNGRRERWEGGEMQSNRDGIVISEASKTPLMQILFVQ